MLPLLLAGAVSAVPDVTNLATKALGLGSQPKPPAPDDGGLL